jgi:hypothetical protein
MILISSFRVTSEDTPPPRAIGDALQFTASQLHHHFERGRRNSHGALCAALVEHGFNNCVYLANVRATFETGTQPAHDFIQILIVQIPVNAHAADIISVPACENVFLAIKVGTPEHFRAISLAVPIMSFSLIRAASPPVVSQSSARQMVRWRDGFQQSHQLLMTAAEVAAQLLMVMVAVVPAAVIQHQRREDDPRHFPADSLLKPVIRIAEGQALHVRRHITAAFRQPVKLPESP